MRSLLKWAFLLALMPCCGGCLPHSVSSTQVGIKVKKIALFGEVGVVDEPFEPGTYFFLPLINDWYTLDTTLKTLIMTFDSRNADLGMRDDLVFKTIDGNDISLDLNITYRIDPLKAGHLLKNVGLSDADIKDHIVRSIARSKPRDIFGQLTTEQFYDPIKRSEKAHETEKALNDVLNPYGIIVDGVKTKDYRFNPAYEMAIKDKKVADQKTQRYISETKAAKEDYKKKLQDANGDVNEMVAKVDGAYKQAELSSNAYYEQRKREAQAIRIEGEAEALAIKKMNEALTGNAGLAKVKLEVAKSLQNKKILVMPFNQGGIDIKSTNVNSLIETYGAKALSEKN
ncbi:hypothetical protein AB834_00785 [PVC group bacterium (ex Bugula neritina AB1)]|nr:hypothetical protein AB834_00785 [PVC group bacterium (ex Bugula neritina AB1)]